MAKSDDRADGNVLGRSLENETRSYHFLSRSRSRSLSPYLSLFFLVSIGRSHGCASERRFISRARLQSRRHIPDFSFYLRLMSFGKEMNKMN